MAASLSGLSSFSTCLASTTSKTASFHLHKKTNRVSFSAPLVTPSVLRSKRLPSLFAASGDIDVEVDTSQPEPVEAQLASAAAVASETPKGAEVFAVVMIGSRQYIVFPGRFIYTQRLKGANVDDKIVLNKVLLVGTKENAYIGQPVVSNAVVHAVVEEQGLNSKVLIFKYKRKKNYRRTIGHRQPNTRLRITGITGYENFPADPILSS
ncbi:putative 50S ribosomal protein L21 [Zostera marina]|uniref:Putative 50S ribosomal protein L21 n=1 Tax=Zostera marina TaxID=29655 RepID=A0A0K9NSW3_ZOSMR|nr:putative 50S ribosomal protein L21 [Zostera marina]